jgi:integrase
MAKRNFGNVRRLPSGRFQARYTGPDGRAYTARKADGRPMTFDSRQYAGKYLERVSGEIQAGKWVSPDVQKTIDRTPPVTLRAYAETWLASRTWKGRELSPSTRLLYRIILDRQILPGLGDLSVVTLSPLLVREWHAKLDTGPTQRAHAYSLLRTILATAVADDVIAVNPCRVAGAGQAQRAGQTRPASLAELETIAATVPAKYKLMILLAAWCALRFGELAELRRSDLDVKNGIVHVRRGVVRGETGLAVKGPKSEAGKRDVNIPPHLMPLVREHLRDRVPAGPHALVFPGAQGGHLSHSSVGRWYYPARAAAGRDDLRFHDLRHTGAVLAAATGATLAELMARLGHSTVSAAMRYQHAAADRDKAIAEALSKLATVTPITAAKGTTRKRKEASRQ